MMLCTSTTGSTATSASSSPSASPPKTTTGQESVPITTSSSSPSRSAMASSHAATPPSAKLNLMDCSATALAKFLVHERFHSNGTEATKFVEALQKAVAAISVATVTPPGSNSNNNHALSFDQNLPPLLSQPLETSLLTPRMGKVQIQLFQGALVATPLNPTAKFPCPLVIPSSSVTHCILFPKPEDVKLWKDAHSKKTKKIKPPNSHLVLLRLDPSIAFQNKPLSKLSFALSWNKPDGPTGPVLSTPADSSTDSDTDEPTKPTYAVKGLEDWTKATKAWRNVLEASLGHDQESLVVVQVPTMTDATTSSSSSPLPFRSHQTPDTSTTTGGMPFVKCYNGVQDGVLFPLEEGLLFYKPPLFLPRSDLHSIACGRGGGGGQQNASRYVDMVLQLQGDDNGNGDDKDVVEFTNIQREELGVLNEYIQTVLIPAMKKDAQTGQKAAKDDSVVAASGSDTENEDSAVEVQAQVEDDDDDEEMDDEISDDDDEVFGEGGDEDDEENDDESEDGDDSDDDDDGVEVVQDDFAKELAGKQKSDESVTESEDEQAPTRSKRRRTT